MLTACWLTNARKPAHRGAAMLVPPQSPAQEPWSLHAGNRDPDSLHGGDENAQIQGAVLFRSDESLPVHQEDRFIALVDEFQFRDTAALGHLSDLGALLGQSLIQGQIVRCDPRDERLAGYKRSMGRTASHRTRITTAPDATRVWRANSSLPLIQEKQRMRKTPTVAGIRMGLSPTALLPSRLKPRLPHLIPSS